ncbi:MAG: DUF192 domain-containing protein, partial [Myxococcaceae bacterium]
RTRGKVLATRAEEATGFGDRFLGLMGRRELPFGEGLHLVPCNSIHTFFMRIPIDALFLDAEGKVRKAFPGLSPWRVTGVYFKVRSVLELPAGTVAGSGTLEGDELVFERS